MPVGFRVADLLGLAGILIFLISPAQAQPTETVLHNFGVSPRGAGPEGFIRDSAGNFFGTALFGGASNAGVVFKLDSTGRETVLYSFTGGADGSGPVGSLVRDSAGNFYGVADAGGASNLGVVFKLDVSGHETVLHSFYGGTDGANPVAGLVRDSAGNLYGTTENGGASQYGVVFKQDTSGLYTVLHSFAWTDGAFPEAALILDSAGNLYGTTNAGGPSGAGVVFKVDTAGTETVLYSFARLDGSGAQAGLIRDAAGNFYGTTASGGIAGLGVVFKLDTTGHETVLHSFMRADGAQPQANLIWDPAGNLYGTTYFGGASNQGVIFKVDTAGNETVLHSFSGPDGSNPQARLVRDSSGDLFGITYSGGSQNEGAVFKLDTTGQETVLFSFTASAAGSGPVKNLIRDAAGNYYGTTSGGGTAGQGVVFKLDTTGHETVLHSFTGADGANPESGLIWDPSGDLYGTTSAGGSSNQGVVYKLDPNGNETVLHSFTGGADGGWPLAGLIRDSAGNLYGTTASGGTSLSGTVFKVDPTGRETVLHNFSGGLDGGGPEGDLIGDGAGNLYGTTIQGAEFGAGNVFKLDKTGHVTVLYSFTAGADGGYSRAGLVRDSAGNLYGTTGNGGTGSGGVVFKVDTTGLESVLYAFSGGLDGGTPMAGVILDSAGNLYGTAANGGDSNHGVVFKVDATGQETVLHSFTGADGAGPSGALIRDSAGNLYGTTSAGGKYSGGAVFKISP